MLVYHYESINDRYGDETHILVIMFFLESYQNATIRNYHLRNDEWLGLVWNSVC